LAPQAAQAQAVVVVFKAPPVVLQPEPAAEPQVLRRERTLGTEVTVSIKQESSIRMVAPEAAQAVLAAEGSKSG
jgi:hypothetical protein